MSKTDKISEDRNDNRHSRLYNTPLYEFMRNAELDVADAEKQFKTAVEVFEKESAQSFAIPEPNNMIRIEPLRTFIIKLLLSIGVIPRNNAFAVVARITELLVIHPDIAMDKLIVDFAKSHSTDKSTVSRMIDKCFDVYDDKFMTKVTALTQSHPNTAKDVLCDIAVYISATYGSEQKIYE